MATPDPAQRPDGDAVWSWLESRYREYRGPLFTFALRELGNREDAEDAMQIALLHAHRALVRGDRPARPRAWLFTIVLNVCRRLHRQASARRRLIDVSGALAELGRGADIPSRAEISAAVASLPRGQREIFILRELQGLSYSELGERLDLSPAAAESLLARARRRLRGELGVLGETPEAEQPARRRGILALPLPALVKFGRRGTALKLAAAAGAAAVTPVVVVGIPALPHAASPRPVERPAALVSAAPPRALAATRSVRVAGGAATSAVVGPRVRVAPVKSRGGTR
ncbi:MAG TPA: sigma-70 family RNA polymerase sigma factor, partial [Gaiellaceae bacterium]|nr:sigma-70 family RNA polymerase sigma factor [Gaiellaceae bacterium]